MTLVPRRWSCLFWPQLFSGAWIVVVLRNRRSELPQGTSRGELVFSAITGGYQRGLGHCRGSLTRLLCCISSFFFLKGVPQWCSNRSQDCTRNSILFLIVLPVPCPRDPAVAVTVREPAFAFARYCITAATWLRAHCAVITTHKPYQLASKINNHPGVQALNSGPGPNNISRPR